MSRITDLRTGKGREKRINIYLDGRFAFSLGAEVAAKENLQVGQDLSVDQIESLTGGDQLQRCLEAAYRYLGYRPRSESELRERMQRRGFVAETVDAAITRLKEQQLLDDEAFAQFWRENRESFGPRSQWLTGLELKRMGVMNGVIEQAVAGMDDEENAYRAALQKTRRWTPADTQSFRRRLGDYLRRRGFKYEVINHTVERIWQERGNGSG
ncbi:MAG TPA: RecX family transcriptional regulator [Dehalococcoidales bacterium]|nr:RecX family transcriptional regulator [Dehalococcoidales bacterium]